MFAKNEPNVVSYHRHHLSCIFEKRKKIIGITNICLSQGNNSMGPIEVMTPAKYA
ncbi:hypothetical protein PAHAL_5G095400 [Panicum hallii]|jgi:hypothetical protein|uniref:Uncharacterized protein n=1 Tax=Panicum hallii TaxID=206008 RepID=A0A2T8IJF1_9POAL|nr:hypothetical protein PAHAL_5G095400 [Panicum hallii]